MNTSELLTIATRGYAVPRVDESARRKTGARGTNRNATPERLHELPRLTLVFDCETTIDAAQALSFGAYRVYDGDQLIEEGLFHADDLADTDTTGYAALQAHARERLSDAPTEHGIGRKPLVLRSRREFINAVVTAQLAVRRAEAWVGAAA